MRARACIIVAVLGLLLLPAGATAQKCAGDDVAAIDQYCELLPTAEGRAPSDTSPHRLGQLLPVSERGRLWRAGPSGRALLAMPMGARLHGRRLALQPLPGAADAVAGWLAADRSRAPHEASLSAWSGERLSELFRWLLLMSTVGLVGTAWVRRRR